MARLGWCRYLLALAYAYVHSCSLHCHPCGLLFRPHYTHVHPRLRSTLRHDGGTASPREWHAEHATAMSVPRPGPATLAVCEAGADAATTTYSREEETCTQEDHGLRVCVG